MLKQITNHKSQITNKGFTLIELIVVMAILGVLAVFVIMTLNPFYQYKKAQDARRKSDVTQVRNALDTYYNDYNCYPATVPFGQEWKVVNTNTTYMKTVPQDPNYSSDGSGGYTYIIDSADLCPQWYVLFNKLAIPPLSATPACHLQPNCLPLDYNDSGYNSCEFSGDVNCEKIQAVKLSTETVTPTPTLIPSPTPLLSPTPTPIPIFFYYCGGCADGHQICNQGFGDPPPDGTYYLNPNDCSIACDSISC